MNSPIVENKPCCCLDEDEYSCYYLRLKKRFGRKQAERYLEGADGEALSQLNTERLWYIPCSGIRYAWV
jgi:hypothetical protein